MEGTHDQIVLETLYGAELRRARAVAIPMHGIPEAQFALRVRDLVVYSEARIRLMVDNISPAAAGLWAQAAEADARGDDKEARRRLEGLGKQGATECKDLAAAGIAALSEGRLGRIELIALSKRDIVNYLPVADFRTGAESWEQLWDDAPPEARTSGRAFKNWAGVTTATVQASIDRNRDREFPEIGRVVEGL